MPGQESGPSSAETAVLQVRRNDGGAEAVAADLGLDAGCAPAVTATTSPTMP